MKTADPARCHLEDGPAISPATAQRIACQATVSWMLHDHHGNVLDAGRRHRRPPPALRRAVRERDRYRCQAPGCQSRRTDIHHIRPWANGGTTRLRDLILLGDKLNLDLAIWACFANARVAEERRQAQEQAHAHDLAA